ncbi:hypothetical protein [uncultured Methanomethylovorans sp.]|uniref:hypothetical protein n=1 Tax=uncultured Methanomethylovorans sp. TaxID=183759 RepID=UPI002AA63788|nr:hypothetical protein [uncultured Methanomethylovorans sp.]
MNIDEICKKIFLKLIVISLLLTIFSILIGSHELKIQILILILPIMGIPIIRDMNRERNKGNVDNRILWIGLASVFTLSVFIRYYPYFWTNVPPGYDPGLYKYGFDTYISNLPGIPESTLPQWFKEMFPQGIVLLSDILYVVAGFRSTEIIKIFTPLVCGLMAFPVFAVSKQISSERGAVISTVIYLLSATQYVLFEYSYLKNIIGLFLMLIAIILLQKERYITTAIIYAALSIYHQPHFLLLSLVLLCLLLETKNPKIYLTGIIAALLILPFCIPRMELVVSMLNGLLSVALSNLTNNVNTQGGTFLSFSKYGYLSFPYITFGILGFIYMFLNKKRDPLFYFTLITSALVIFKIVFFRRYLATLDILLIVLAGGCIQRIVFEQKKELMAYGKIILLLIMFTGSLLLHSQMADNSRLISDSDLLDIQWMADNIRPQRYILTTAYDAPWVLGWGKHPVIAPGLFHWDINTQEDWDDFLRTSDSKQGAEFMSKYDKDIYIYHSMNIENIELSKYSGNEFQLIRNDKSKIYRYTGPVQ